MRRFSVRGVLVCGLLGLALAMPNGRAGAASATGRVAGDVVDWATGRPVAGATVILPEYAARTRSGPDGAFTFPRHFATEAPYRRIRAVVVAPSYGRWAVSGIPLLPNDTLLLHAEMRRRDWDHRVLAPHERGVDRNHPALSAREPVQEQRTGLAGAGETCTGWRFHSVPPRTIRVYLTEERVSRRYGFYFYLRHVLPSEWIASWDHDALGAGAVAAKTYAHWRTQPGHAYSSGRGCADVVDTVADQIFDPTYSHLSTDRAVYAAMGSMLLRDGRTPLTQYWSGARGDPCEPVTDGAFAGRMSQWGTQSCALAGMRWPGITRLYYRGTSFRYLRNMVVNPSFEAAVGTYPWRRGHHTALSREEGTAYGTGRWFLEAAPEGRTTWAFTNVRMPIVGDPDTRYASAFALRCPVSNARRCTIEVTVRAVARSGSAVGRSRTIVVRRDRRWHHFTFAPSPHGIGHSVVQLSFLSRQTFRLDAATLRAPFGGR